QAEDGIRDLIVTGVQTCALPISVPRGRPCSCHGAEAQHGALHHASRWSCWWSGRFWFPILGRSNQLPAEHRRASAQQLARVYSRSEERRVGKECRSREWVADPIV